MGFEVFDEFIGLKLKESVVDDLSDYEEFECECDLDEEDKSGYIFFIIDTHNEEIDDLEGTLVICVSIQVDEDFCIAEVEPRAEFYSGEDGDPEVDAEEYWTDKDIKVLVKILKSET